MHDEAHPPGTVIAAVAAGTVATPFLAVYAVLFVLRGLIVGNDQPDVGSSPIREAGAGLLVAAFLIATVVGLSRVMAGRSPWLFAGTQLTVLGVASWLLADRSTGDPQLPALLALGALAALALVAPAPSRRWTGRESTTATPDSTAEGDAPVQFTVDS